MPRVRSLFAFALGCLTAACAGQPVREDPAPVAAPAELPAPLLSAVSAPEPVPVQPPLQRLCWTATHVPAAVSHVVYDFAEEELWPLPVGPRVAERSVQGIPRAVADLRAAVAPELLRGCYRWARFKEPALRTALTVSADVQPLGEFRNLSVQADTPAGAALAACVRDVLTPARVPQAGARLTRARFVLRFAPSVLSAPQRPPVRPLVPRPASLQRACVRAPVPLAVDALAPAGPLYEIDDYNEDLAAAERDAEEDRKLREARQRCPSCPAMRRVRTPIIRMGTPITIPMPDRAYLRDTVRSNLGAYRACYEGALVRHPWLTGRVTLKLAVDRAGTATARVESTPALDAEFTECLRAAAEQVWFDPWPQHPLRSSTVELNYPLVLHPAPPQQPEGPAELRAQQLLVLGDGAGALRLYTSLLDAARAAGEHSPRECLWHVGALHAGMARFPWHFAEPRVDALADALAARLRQDRPGQNWGCAARAEEALLQLTGRAHELWSHTRVPVFAYAALRGYARLEPLAAHLPDPPGHPYAEMLMSVQRPCDAAPRYEAAAAPGSPRQREAAAGAVLAYKGCIEQTERSPGAGGETLGPLRARLEQARARLRALGGADAEPAR